MGWRRTSTNDEVPTDPLGEAVAEALTKVIVGASVEMRYAPSSSRFPDEDCGEGAATAIGPGPDGWQVKVVISLHDRVTRLVTASGGRTSLGELLDVLPDAAVRVLEQFRNHGPTQWGAAGAALRRAMRDTLAAEVLGRYLQARVGRSPRADLVASTIEYLIELSGTRVESHDLTHGVVITDAIHDTPRLHFTYPRAIRPAKRAPLLFDGQRSVLLVDSDGRARTELQRHRFQRLTSEPLQVPDDDAPESGSLVAAATSALGGLGFFVRADRSIWTFVDGRPLLVRRSEHWTAFPLELTASIENMIGGGSVAALVARAAFMISTLPGGAILAVVDKPSRLAGTVSPKDRYDLRNDIDPAAMRTETRLHHLIDAKELDEETLVRLALLDGATVLDREGQLLAYGAIVTSSDSQHEGARTAAARTLSETADVVLKISVDGDITVFRGGEAVTTLLGQMP